MGLQLAFKHQIHGEKARLSAQYKSDKDGPWHFCNLRVILQPMRMGQDISVYTENLPNINMVPHIHQLLPHIHSLKQRFKRNTDGFDWEKELRSWLVGQQDIPPCLKQVAPYRCSRTSIGSPAVNRRSFTEEELQKFERENDGFPLPSTEEELKAFDRDTFSGTEVSTEKLRRSKKRPKNRQRSKSATAVPDLSTIRQKLQLLQAPGKPKFLEHLINRVVSKKIGRQNTNGLIPEIAVTTDDPPQLSPETEKCLEDAECLVEEILSCSKRPASGESTDSGKGSLVESTSDFSPTPKRTSWSTPTSPSFHGIVKQRLKNFQTLHEASSDTDSITTPTSSTPEHKTFQDRHEHMQELLQIDSTIKEFYCSVSQDETFNAAIMASGYVKALVAKIDQNKKLVPQVDKTEPENDDEGESAAQNGALSSSTAKLRLVPNGEDEDDLKWKAEIGEICECEDDNGEVFEETGKRDSTSSKNSPNRTTPIPTPRTSVNSSHTNSRNSSSSSRSNSVASLRANSHSDSDNHEEEEDEKPKDKLHQIAYEVLTTERAYVARLKLLEEVFHFRVVSENSKSNFMPPEIITQMFANIQPIYNFHKMFLLPDLETRMKDWSTHQKIGDIIAKLAPFLKLYTEYVKNFDKSMALIDKWNSQSPKFSTLLQEIQKEPACGQLTLQHHMLEPISRVPRYELLLKAYLKHLAPDSPDRENTQKALDLVITAASHSNTAMKKIEKFHKLLSILQNLNGEGLNDLVSPSRELVKEGSITKISARSGERQARYLFLFNDKLLVCSEQIMGKYKVRANLKVTNDMEIQPGDNLNIQNTFCVKFKEKNIEFLDEANNGNGLDWFVTFQQVISDFQQRIRLRIDEDQIDLDQADMGCMLGKKAPTWDKDQEVTICHTCQDKFTALKRKHHCRACGHIFCSRCSSKKHMLEYEDTSTPSRVCVKCFGILNNSSGDLLDVDSLPPTPASPKQRPADDKAAILASFLNISDNKGRSWTKRWITIHPDFAAYFYKKNKDVAAFQTMALPGHQVRVVTDLQDKTNVFSLAHKASDVCHFQADSELQLQQWVRVLEKMVQLELPSNDDKRLSTHSTGSCQSNSSGQSGNSTISASTDM